MDEHGRGPVRAVFFDLDGTLVDHDAAVATGLTVLKRRHEDPLGPIPLDELRDAWGVEARRWFARYLAGQVSFVQQRRGRVAALWEAAGADAPTGLRCDDLFGDFLDGYRQGWRLFDDVTRALDRLARLDGLRLGIVTNGDAAQQRAKLDRLGLAAAFDPVVVSSEVGVAKPDPAIFEAAAAAAGVPVADCVHVGDDLNTDARAAGEAGGRGVWLDRDDAGTDPEPPVARIVRLDELPDLLDA